jgi:hypothetical protein
LCIFIEEAFDRVFVFGIPLLEPLLGNFNNYKGLSDNNVKGKPPCVANKSQPNAEATYSQR